MSGLEIKALEANHCLATVGPLVVLIWGRETTEAALALLTRSIADVARLSPSGVALITLVSEDSVPPPAALRSTMANALKGSGTIDGKPALLRSAVVFDGKGFMAAVVRGVVTGLQFLQRFPFPHQVFESTESALGWLFLGSPLSSSRALSAAEVLAQIRALRDRFDQHRKGAR